MKYLLCFLLVWQEPVSNYIIIPKYFAYKMALKRKGNCAFPPPTYFVGGGDTFYVCDPNMADMFYLDFKPLFDSGVVNPNEVVWLGYSSFPNGD